MKFASLSLSGCVLTLVLIPSGAADKPVARTGKLEYNRDVRPILAENCFSCHGPDSAARKGKLRLDDRAFAIEKGAITPGKPTDSEMINRIFLPDTDEEAMPPKSSHKVLKPEQKETLRRWIAEGAEYQPHWSFLTPKRPAVPTFDDAEGKAWGQHPIDAFVLKAMREKKLSPNPEADRRTLARRLSYDLTGLPPEPADVTAFVNDSSPDWYEKYVDKLMASPHWGEHRGRYWLDYVRYADTHGIHFDNYREMWSYRDWVIKAFNRNQPFDQFALEQLAGDLLPNPSLDQLIATGFNRCNITTNEGGAINEEYLVLYTRDRTEAANQVFMGLTAGCAVCHDHKFDPISAKEFYSMAAFFNNTTQKAMDGNIQNTPPAIPVPRDEDRPLWESLKKEVETARAKIVARKTEAQKPFEAWAKTASPSSVLNNRADAGLLTMAWLDEGGDSLHALENGKPRSIPLPAEATWKAGPSGGKALALKPGTATVSLPMAGDFDGSKPFSAGLWVQIPQRGQNAAVLSRLTIADGYRGWDIWCDNDKFAVHMVGQWPKDGFKVIAKTGVNVNNWHHVFFTYDGSRKANGLKLYVNGELQGVDSYVNDAIRDEMGVSSIVAPKDTIHTPAPLHIGKRHDGQALKAVHVLDLRIFDRALDAGEVKYLQQAPAIATALNKPQDKRSPAERDELITWWMANYDKQYQVMKSETDKLFAKEAEIKGRGTIAHISVERAEMPEAYVLARGDYDKRTIKVSPDTPKALPAFPADLPRNRLGFAKWLLRPEHPLMSRVTVNRFWQELFGQGLVRTPGDFGITGDQPSHPELLDWVSLELINQKWDVKKFFKILVTSKTYRQTATVTPEKLEADPSNKWLSRGPRYRMDAEMLRDTALAASGLLVRQIGGPSVKPYQPEGVWEAVAMIGSNTRDYKQDKADRLYRRSMYTFWKRAAPPASMEILNAPNRETCAVKRERTNTPLQALVTLNDIQFVEAARQLATHAIAEGGGDDVKTIHAISERLIARRFTDRELSIVKQSLAAVRSDFSSKPDEAKKLISYGESKPDPKLDPIVLASWTMLANELMNLDEVLTK